MKKFFSLILLLVFAAQTFSQGVVLLNFYIYRVYIAKNQCVNRFKPMLHCNGKCVLAKKLKEQEKKEQQQPELKLSEKTETISSHFFFISDISFTELPAVMYPFFTEPVIAGNTSIIFHPPCW